MQVWYCVFILMINYKLYMSKTNFEKGYAQTPFRFRFIKNLISDAKQMVLSKYYPLSKKVTDLIRASAKNLGRINRKSSSN